MGGGMRLWDRIKGAIERRKSRGPLGSLAFEQKSDSEDTSVHSLNVHPKKRTPAEEAEEWLNHLAMAIGNGNRLAAIQSAKFWKCIDTLWQTGHERNA